MPGTRLPILAELHGHTNVIRSCYFCLVPLKSHLRNPFNAMLTTNTWTINQLLERNLVQVNLEGSSKEEVLLGITNMLEGDARVDNFEEMQHAVLSREKIMSTGVGKGIALPHAKTSAVNGMALAFATTAEPIEYDSVDSVPVRILFLIVSAEKEKTRHIKLLSRISRLMNRDAVREQLLSARTPEDIITIFRLEEQA